jgi:hypothetical protein
MPANVITGAKAKIRIPGKGIIGYATGISISENTLNGRIESLGYIDSREIVPISRSVTAQCSMIRIFNQYDVATADRHVYNDTASGDGNSQTSDERDMLNTSTASLNLSSRTTNALNVPYFDLDIFDSSNGTTGKEGTALIYTVKNCRIASQNIVVDRASLMGVQVTLEAEYLIRHDAGANIGRIGDDRNQG